MKDDVRDFTNCQMRFQTHNCNAFCMRTRLHHKKSESIESQRRRYCRCGGGVEEDPMQCNTPGFKLLAEPQLNYDLRGFFRIDLPRNNRRVTQAAAYIVRGWRANCDVQFLIYKSHPHNVDAADISRVTNYVVSYACKGSESVVEEKNALKSLIIAAQEEEGDIRDVKRLARRILNQSTKNRIVSKQEALCQLAGLELWNCSEYLEKVSLAGNTLLGTEYQGVHTFLTKYAKRNQQFHHLSLDQYFHYLYNNRGLKQKHKIPIYSGAQCEAVFPASAAYARGVMLIHSPWHLTFTLDKDHDVLLDRFRTFIADAQRCPGSVRISYERAKILSFAKEPTSSNGNINYETARIDPDSETTDLVDLASTIYKSYDEQLETSGMKLDYGLDKDWTERNIKVRTFYAEIYILCISKANNYIIYMRCASRNF